MADYSTQMVLAIASELKNSKVPNYDNFSFKETEDSVFFELETETRMTGKTIITQIYVDVDEDGDDRVLNLSALVDEIPAEFSDKVEQLVSVVNEHWCTDGKFIIDDKEQGYLRLFYRQVGYFDEDEIFDEDYEDELEKFLLIIVSGISAFEALSTSLYMIVDDGYSVKKSLKKNAFIFNLAEKIDDDSDDQYEDDDISENTPDDDTTSIVDDLIDFLREEFEEEPEREFSDLSDDSFEALVNTTRKEAESGDADAQYRLGKIYKSINSNADEKNGFENDRSSFYWFLKAADQGHGLAMCEIARAYRQGVAAGYDGKASIVWCKKAIAAMEGSDNEEEKKAVADAYLDLALLHEIDLTAELDGSTLDKEAAFKYMLESAKWGNYVASFHTADYYMRGNGTLQDENEALIWYKRCLELIKEQNINDEELAESCTAKIKKIKKRQEKEKLLEEQKIKLDELCSSLEDKSHKELTLLLKTIKNEYTDIAKPYLVRIEEVIKTVERKTLDDLVANADSLSYVEYVDLIDQINSFQFKFVDTKPYTDNITKLKNNAQIIETCTDEILSECEIGKLEEYKKAILDSTLSDESKDELGTRVDAYIALCRQCKDRKTLSLLQECEADKLSEYSVPKLTQLKTEIKAHKMLPEDKKAELIKALDLQIKMCEIKKEFKAAQDNYDYLLQILEVLCDDGLPQSFRQEYDEKVRSSIIKAQEDILSKLTEGLEKMEHEDLCQAKETASFYNFDKNICDDTIRKIEAQIDIVEVKKISKMCEDLSSLSAEKLKKLKKKIIKLGFKEEHTKQQLEEIDVLYGNLVFDELIGKCTRVALVKLNDSDLDELLAELKGCGKEEAAPYINRVSSFIDVRKELDDNVCQIYQNHYDKAYDYTVQLFEKLTLPTYSKTHISCYCKPDDLKVEKISERLKVFKLKDLEQVLFLFDDTPTLKSIEEGFCITNFGIHHICNFDKTFIPIKHVPEVKTGKLFESVKIASRDKSIKFSMRDDYPFRNEFANTLRQIIVAAGVHKITADDENNALANSYGAKYLECFERTPIPNDNTFADIAEEQRQTEERTAQELTATQTASVPSVQSQAVQGGNASLYELVPELVAKHNVKMCLVRGTDEFNKKIVKAKAAYAYIPSDETPLFMQDKTVFGSAKEGFVLTDKRIYINIMNCKNKSVLLDDITDVYCNRSLGLTDVFVHTPGGSFRISFDISDSQSNAIKAFLEEFIGYVKSAQTACQDTQPDNAAPNAPEINTSAETSKWQCPCGSINEDMFCPKCGTNKADGAPIWQCACGSCNVDRFCPNCGSQKP